MVLLAYCLGGKGQIQKGNMILTEWWHLSRQGEFQDDCCVAEHHYSLPAHFSTKSFSYCGLVISLFGLRISSSLALVFSSDSASWIASEFGCVSAFCLLSVFDYAWFLLCILMFCAFSCNISLSFLFYALSSLGFSCLRGKIAGDNPHTSKNRWNHGNVVTVVTT